LVPNAHFEIFELSNFTALLSPSNPLEFSMKKFTLTLSVLFFVAALAPALSQETFSLKYQFEKGKTYLYQQSIKGMMTQEIMGQEMKIPMEMDNTSRYLVEDVQSNGNMTLITSYDAFTVKIKSEMIDTVGKVDQLIGKRTRTVINPFGAIVSTAAIDTVEKSDAATFVPPGGLVQVLPGKPVAAGATWSSTRTDNGTSVGQGGNTKTTTNYTLVGREDHGGRELVKITYTGKIEISGTMTQMGMELSIEGSGTVSGEVFFDEAKGQVVEESAKTEMNTVISVSGQEAMTFSGTQNMNSTKKLIEN
jgi:hypothetical protein